jgi:hypothetical protein
MYKSIGGYIWFDTRTGLMLNPEHFLIIEFKLDPQSTASHRLEQLTLKTNRAANPDPTIVEYRNSERGR